MNTKYTARGIISKLFIILFLCAILACILAPASIAGEVRTVTLGVTIGTCIHVSQDGTVRSNVSTASLESTGTLTVIAL
ncbi:MAG: hypothetical protein SWK76_06620 [Actinomycetota bacterium]|nr:hypothetical protein [Actinomycetota bacterium]